MKIENALSLVCFDGVRCAQLRATPSMPERINPRNTLIGDGNGGGDDDGGGDGDDGGANSEHHVFEPNARSVGREHKGHGIRIEGQRPPSEQKQTQHPADGGSQSPVRLWRIARLPGARHCGAR